MQISEVFESANIVSDSKARRVLNTAPDKIAGITIKELEGGVTIERLESLKVPVYQYSTQITIHGMFPDISGDMRVCGYKSVLLNGNGSLGVKYVAIDGGKKKLLSQVSRYSDSRWSIHIDSQGCEAIQLFCTTDNEGDKKRCIECYNSTPDTLYIGGKRAASLMYGGYAVIIAIGAIYNQNIWPLINSLTGIKDQAAYDYKIAESELERAKRDQEYTAKREIELAANKSKLAAIQFSPPANWVSFTGKIEKPGIYAKLNQDYNGDVNLKVIQAVKRGGRLCVNTMTFNDMVYIPWTPSKYKELHYSITGWRILPEVIPDPEVKTSINTSIPEVKTSISTSIGTSMHTSIQPAIIRRNERLHGIEVVFTNKPDTTIIDSLKSLGYRWSRFNNLWYTRFNDSIMNQTKTLIGV